MNTIAYVEVTCWQVASEACYLASHIVEVASERLPEPARDVSWGSIASRRSVEFGEIDELECVRVL